MAIAQWILLLCCQGEDNGAEAESWDYNDDWYAKDGHDDWYEQCPA